MKFSPLWSICRQTQSNTVSFFYLKNRVWKSFLLHFQQEAESLPQCPELPPHGTTRRPQPRPPAAACLTLWQLVTHQSRHLALVGRSRVSMRPSGGGGGEEGENAREAPCWRELGGARGAQQGFVVGRAGEGLSSLAGSRVWLRSRKLSTRRFVFDHPDEFLIAG